jgi:hypothetical protein
MEVKLVRKELLLSVLIALPVLALARPAEARAHHFLGPHPIAAKLGGGYCYIEAPHMHIYAPDHPALYQQVDDQWVFTADPTPFGYEGERHPFYGHHPVTIVDGRPVYCYLDGPHYHPFAPPDDGYRMKDGVAFYVGPYAPEYTEYRPHRVKLVNAAYRPYVAFRPTVVVAPPPEWHGEVYVAPPAVEVQAPGVYVERPHVSVEVNAPGVFVPPAPHVVVGVPPPIVVAPPAPHVVIGAPPPIVVGAPAPRVVVGAPGAVWVGEGRRHHGDDDDDDQGRHHDNGRHEGWYKQGHRH